MTKEWVLSAVSCGVSVVGACGGRVASPVGVADPGRSTGTDSGSASSDASSGGSAVEADAAGGGGDMSASFTPTAILSKLTFWFDPTSLVQAGGQVATWTDLTGNGNDATQAVVGYRPTYTAAGINGLPSVTFQGPITGQRLRGNS